jgi:hypothetical protein
MRFFSIFGLFAALMFSAWIASAAPAQKSDQRQVPKEQQQMIDAAQKAYEASAAMYDVGAGGVTLEAVYTWSKRWAEAEADVATPAESRKALLGHRDRMKTLNEKVTAKYQTGAAGGEKDRYYASQFYLAEAEFWLLKNAKK